MDRGMTILEMAEFLGITRAWCMKLCKSGKVEAYKIKTKFSKGEVWVVNKKSVEKFKKRKRKKRNDRQRVFCESGNQQEQALETQKISGAL